MLNYYFIFICYFLCNVNCDNVTLYKRKICKFDIKIPGISMDSLVKAKECTIVEGKVVITHMSKYMCNSLRFPFLREVTDYILLAFLSCSDETSLNIFPNLMVIRGYELLQGCSLIVYYNAWRHLNFTSLRSITGGNVLVALNSNLCNVGNIDWKYINDNRDEASKSTKKLYIKTNKFICSNSCSNSCPERTIDGQKTRVCWSYNTCQSICDSICSSKDLYCHVNNTSFCCHKQCLGGCYGKTNRDCVACKKLRFNEECVISCPIGYYEFKGSRCVHKFECSKKNMSITLNPNKCVKDCPSDLFASVVNGTKYCVNGSTISTKYNKECGLLFLKSLKDLDQVENCYSAERVIISLQIGGRDLSLKLRDVFKNLRIVKQFIQIMRSNYLESLTFLNPLLEIQGQAFIGQTNVTLDITANNILSKLWNPDPKFRILSGSVRFLANRNLCKTFIHTFINKIGLQNSLFDKELIDSTNGHIAICTFIQLNLSVVDVKSQYVRLYWKNKPNSSYQILSGLTYYRSISNNMKNGGFSDSGCSSVMWSVIEAQCKNNETGVKLKSTSLWPQDGEEEFICEISSLKPATSYQVYLEFRFTRQDSAAISNHVFFTTSTEMPSPPQIIESISSAHNEIRLSWKPPLHPNGLITKYMIYYWENALFENSFNNEYLNKDFCQSETNTQFKSSQSNFEKAISDTFQPQMVCDTCSICKKTCERNPQKQEELLEMTRFDTHMHSVILVQRKKNYQYSLTSSKSKSIVIPTNITVIPVNTTMPAVHKPKPKSFISVENTSSINVKQIEIPASPLKSQYYHVITNLDYFTEYLIEIVACHQRQNNFNYSQQILMKLSINDCSNRASISTRTERNPDVDVIPPIYGKNYMNITGVNKEIIVTWKIPPKVNGLILFYQLNYRIKKDNAIFQAWTPNCIDSKSITYIRNFHVTNSSYKSFIIRNPFSGTYEFQIMIRTLAGNGNWSPLESFEYKETNVDVDYVIKISLSSTVALMTVIVISVLIWLFVWRKNQRYILTRNNHYFLSGQDEWNIEFPDVKLLLPIGKGNFGIVYSGELKKLESPSKSLFVNASLPMKVAVKTVSQAATLEDIVQFLSEACLMKQFLGYHIVHLIGIYAGNIQKNSSLYPLVVMELMENGDLSNYLHQYAERSDKGMIDGKQSLLWAIQIADGMCYLACKRFVHRDLAARNCLVDADLNIKIGDFGLTKSINENDYYRKRGRAKAPVRWMAPESLRSAIYTTKTDVWSYGVVLYEISTLGSLPYSGMSHESVIEYVRDGGKLDLEDLKVPSSLLDVMTWCWSFCDTDRPTFMRILEYLVPYVDNEFFKQVSFYHNGCSKFDQCYNCTKLNSIDNSIMLPDLQVCKHIYKCNCSNSLSVCDVCCNQSKTTCETQDIVTFSVNDLLQQQYNNDNNYNNKSQ